MTFIKPWAVVLITLLVSCQKESRQVNVDTTKCDPEKTPEKCKKGNISKNDSKDDNIDNEEDQGPPSADNPGTEGNPGNGGNQGTGGKPPTGDNTTPPPTENPPTNPDTPGGPDTSKPNEVLESLGLVLELNAPFPKASTSPIATLKADEQHKDVLSKISKVSTSYEGVFTKAAVPTSGSDVKSPINIGSLKINVLVHFEYNGKKCESKVAVDSSQKRIPITSSCK